MSPRLFKPPLLLAVVLALAGCRLAHDQRAEAARPPDSTQAPAPLAIDAAEPGTQAAEASGSTLAAAEPPNRR